MLCKIISVFMVLLVLNLARSGGCGEGDGFVPMSYAYILQAEKLAKTRAEVVVQLTGCGRDLIVLDAFFGGGEGGRWQEQEIAAIRSGKKGRRVVCYFSIGEAEDYRTYWQPEWKDKKPDFLLGENPDWPGNYRVKYWNPQWRGLLFNDLDKIIQSGFDGVMLDIVDGFEYFEGLDGEYVDDRINKETKNTYRQDMRKLVISIAKHGRKAHPDFLIIPQNGSQLLSDKYYAEAVSAQALESVFTLEKEKQPVEHVKFILHNLQPLLKAGKPVLTTEYPQTEQLREYAYNRARKYGFLLLLTIRELDILGTTGEKFRQP